MVASSMVASVSVVELSNSSGGSSGGLIKINKCHHKTHQKTYYAVLPHQKPPSGGFSSGGLVAFFR